MDCLTMMSRHMKKLNLCEHGESPSRYVVEPQKCSLKLWTHQQALWKWGNRWVARQLCLAMMRRVREEIRIVSYMRIELWIFWWKFVFKLRNREALAIWRKLMVLHLCWCACELTSFKLLRILYRVFDVFKNRFFSEAFDDARKERDVDKFCFD